MTGGTAFARVIWPREGRVPDGAEGANQHVVDLGVEVKSNEGGNANGDAKEPSSKASWTERLNAGYVNRRAAGAGNEEAPVGEERRGGEYPRPLEEGVNGEVEADICSYPSNASRVGVSS